MHKKKTFKRIQAMVIGLVLLLIGYNIYYVMGPSFNDAINAYNPRLKAIETSVVRGNLYDYTGTLLATTLVEGETHLRVYPYGPSFVHAIGYAHLGLTGIEALANIRLLQSHSDWKNRVFQELALAKPEGDHVYTTLDADLQLLAYDLLQGHKGAIMAMDPTTGQILAMVSLPAYDPNTLKDDWEALRTDREGAPLLNRSTGGLYPPGSTYKLVTGASFLMQGDSHAYHYYCTGSLLYGHNQINCFGNIAHGDLDFKTALAVSCNTAFAQMGLDLSQTDLDVMHDQLKFNQNLPYPLPHAMSRYPLTDNATEALKAETAIGQGALMMTPLHNLLIVSAIANDGVLMTPYLIDRVESASGALVEKYLPIIHDTWLDAATAATLKEGMIQVVESGTGQRAKVEGMQVAGKTGTAEVGDGTSHAWFVGFAPAYRPEIALVVLIENGGTGGSVAAPIAGTLINYYKNIEK